MLAIRGGEATLFNNTGKSIGRIAFSEPLLPGSNLKIGGKEVEVDACISKHEYLAYVNASTEDEKTRPTPKSKPNPKPTSPPLKLSMQAQMKAQIQKEKTQAPKQDQSHQSRLAAFKPPVKNTTGMKQSSDGTPTPKYDPSLPGALIFKRPRDFT